MNDTYPQYRDTREVTLYLNGRKWVKRMWLAPWTVCRHGETAWIQGDHWSVNTYDADGNFAARYRTSREVRPPRRPASRKIAV